VPRVTRRPFRSLWRLTANAWPAFASRSERPVILNNSVFVSTLLAPQSAEHAGVALARG
jgi:hypothetical protein